MGLKALNAMYWVKGYVYICIMTQLALGISWSWTLVSRLVCGQETWLSFCYKELKPVGFFSWNNELFWSTASWRVS